MDKFGLEITCWAVSILLGAAIGAFQRRRDGD
uniref:Uncharacterized protein n=1 Tax=Microbacterium phage Judebell TaxID=3230835 RepID=A0AAU8EIH3_9CAUD